MARTDYYAITTPTLQATSQAIRTVNGTVGTIAPEDYPDLISAMKSGTDYDNVMAQLVEETTTPAAIASFTDGANNIPVKELICTINPTETGTGEKSPSNPYVIGGHTGINICHTPTPVASLWTIDNSFNGIVAFNQLIDKSKFINVNHSDYTVVNNNDGSLTVTIINTLASNVNVLLTSNATPSYVKLPRTHRYILFDNNILPNGVIYRNGYNGILIGVNTIRTQTAVLDYVLMSIVLPSGLTPQTFTIKPNIVDLTQMFGSTIADYIYSLEQGTAGAGVAFFRSIYPNDYYTYDAGTDEMVGSREGVIHTADFGQTVYGGSLNVTTGVLTINKEIVDLGSLNWRYKSTYAYFSAVLPKRSVQAQACVCSAYNYSGYSVGSSRPDKTINTGLAYFDSQNRVVSVKDTDYSDPAIFKTAMDGIMCAYPLGETTELQLDPIEVRTLLGANNLYHDCNGNIKVTYRANGALYVDQH